MNGVKTDWLKFHSDAVIEVKKKNTFILMCKHQIVVYACNHIHGSGFLSIVVTGLAVV